jgi:hypothetical protein
MKRRLVPRLARLLFLLAPLAGCTPARGAPTEPREVRFTRQLRDSAAHRVELELAVGHLTVGSTNDPLLYDARLRYDEARGDAVHEYDAAARSVVLGMPGRNFRLARGDGDHDETQLNVELTTAVPIDLSIDGAATAARLDLGRLALTGLEVDAGVGVTSVYFAEPNRARMEELALNVSAGALVVRDVANANADRVVIAAAVGRTELEFSGEWARDLEARVDVTLGRVVLLVPRHVGVELTTDTFFASVDPGPLRAAGKGRYVSANFAEAAHKLRVTADVMAGGLEVRISER